MSGDPVDRLRDRLVEAAKIEPVREGAPERALEAMRRESRRRGSRRISSAVAPAVLLAAALGGLVILLRRHEPPTLIGEEPPGSLRHAVTATATPTSEPVAPAPSVSSPEPPPKTRVRPLPSATLADELASLKTAQEALSKGDTTTALGELDRYDRILRGQQMRSESTFLRMEALSRSGRAAAAAALARRFVAENPESPLVDRARTFLSTHGDAGGP